MAFLVVACAVGSIVKVVIAQQRLSSKAEAIALAGAAELEFNQTQTCSIAREFGLANFAIDADCFEETASVEVRLTEQNPNRFLTAIMPNIHATARAGIVVSDQINGVD